MDERRPTCTILGGSNGSGKSSIVEALRPVGTFVNADAAARLLEPANPEAASFAAGRQVIRQLEALIRDGASFVYETTLSGNQPLDVMRRAKEATYEIGNIGMIEVAARREQAPAKRRDSVAIAVIEARARPPNATYARWTVGGQ